MKIASVNKQKTGEKGKKKKTAVLLKPVVICGREECKHPLKTRQKKFCSRECRNIVLKDSKSPGGPTKYKPEYATTKIKEYVDLCEKGHEPTLIPTSNSFLVIHNAKIPSLDGYADFLDVSTPTLENWGIKHDEMSIALDHLIRKQKLFLMDNGLSGRYSPVLSKLMLGSNHGMIEKKEVETTHKLLGIVKHFYSRVDELEDKKYGGNG